MVDIENRGEEIRVSYFDKEGNLKLRTFKIPRSEQWKWEYCTPGDPKRDKEFMSWDEKPVKRVPSKYLDKFRIDQYLMTLPESETKEIYEFNIPRKYFIDIEVEVTDSFPEPEVAANPVTSVSITTLSSPENPGQILVLGLKDLSPSEIAKIKSDVNVYFAKYPDIKWDFQYMKMKDEYDLLFTLFSKLIPKMPFITGWNFIRFDWKYLKNRCRKLNIQPELASPSGKLIGKDELPQHRLMLDYLEIYKKYDNTVKLKENFKLDYTGERVVGLRKIKYNGTLQQLYEQDFQKFIFYNAVDTTLVYFIDKELNTLLTFLMIGNVARIEASRAMSPIWITEAKMNEECWIRKRALFSDQNKSKVQKDYDGAYVKDPIVGLHNWIASFDFASLYPTTMRQFNICPTTFKGMNVDTTNKNWVKTASGAVFDLEHDSVLKTILTNMYAGRVVVKGKWKTIDKEMEILKKALKDK